MTSLSVIIEAKGLPENEYSEPPKKVFGFVNVLNNNTFIKTKSLCFNENIALERCENLKGS